MPCAGTKLTAEQVAQRDQKLRDLERQIQSGRVTVKVSGRTVEFVGWQTDRTNPGHWHDDCAYRTLLAEGSSALRMALARAQTQTGRMERTAR